MIMSVEEFETFSPFKDWFDPPDVGTHWKAKTSHLLSEIEKTNDYNAWQASKDQHDTFINLQTALTGLLAKLIHRDYHFTLEGEIGIGGDGVGFGMATPKEIFDGLMEKYGTTTYTEQEKHLSLLDTPIDINAPLEKYFRVLETALLFFMRAPDCDPLGDADLIRKAKIALSKFGPFAKKLREWKASGNSTWKEFKVHMLKAYSEITEDLGEGGTLGGEGYSQDVAYLGTTTNPNEEDDAGSLSESIIEIVNNVSAQNNELASRMAALEVNQAVYAAHGSAPPPTIHFQATKKRKNDTQFNGSPQQPIAPQPYQAQPYSPAPPQNWNTYQMQGGQGTPAFGNTTKYFDNNLYCYTHGFDVDHPGASCPAPKPGHVPHAHRDNAHQFHGACMKAAHKLWQGKPAPAAVLGLNVSRASYATQQQLPQQQGYHQQGFHQYSPQQYQGRGRYGRGGGRGRGRNNGRSGGRGRGYSGGYGNGYGQGHNGGQAGNYGYQGNYYGGRGGGHYGGRGGGYGYGYQH